MLPLVVGVVVAGLGEAEEAAAGLVGAGVAAAGLGEVVAGLWRAKGDRGGGGWPGEVGEAAACLCGAGRGRGLLKIDEFKPVEVGS